MLLIEKTKKQLQHEIKGITFRQRFVLFPKDSHDSELQPKQKSLIKLNAKNIYILKSQKLLRPSMAPYLLRGKSISYLITVVS